MEANVSNKLKSLILLSKSDDFREDAARKVWLFGWLAAWLVGWLPGWLVGCLVGWLVGWSLALKSKIIDFIK